MARSRTVYAPGQQVMFAPESDWTPPRLDELPNWKEAKRVGIDVETKDPTLKTLGPGVRRDGSHLVGVSFAVEDGPSFYLPIRHDGGGNLPLENTLAYLRDQAQIFTGDVCGANLQYDLDWLAEAGIVYRSARRFRDVQVADPLINELHFSYSLESIARRHDLLGKDEGLLREAAAVYGVDPKSDLWRLHSKYVGAYATQDAALPLAILRRQERVIDDDGLWEIYDLESDLLPVLVKMRRRGVRIDTRRCEQAKEWTLGEEARLLDEVHRLTGCRVGVGEVWSAQAMAAPLRHLGVELQLDKNQNPMVNAELLEGLDHPVGKLLLRARQVNKARTSFIDSIERHMTNGRIHATFNQLKRDKEGEEGTEGAAYGRLSCVHPNLQQQPSPGKDPELGGLIRSLYLPEEGSLWAANDYSQQEPRWLTHFAEVCRMPKAREAAERYRNDPKTDNHQMMADMCEIPRKPAKTIYLGLCYGMGGPKLSHSLGLPVRYLVVAGRVRRYFDLDEHGDALGCARETEGRIFTVAGEEAQALLDRFDQRAPYVRALAKLAERQAKKNGYIVTVLGRRCRFPQDTDGNYDWTHKALNRLIQGSSGDQTKKAMIEVDRAGHKPQVQIHDELGQSVRDRRQAEEIARIMETCVECRVPSRVDTEIGPSWGEAK